MPLAPRLAALALLALAACAPAGAIGGDDDDTAMTPDADPAAPDGGPVPTDAAVPLGPAVAYVGGGDDQIHIFGFDPVTLAFTPQGTVATAAGPSFLAFDPQARWLVTVNEGADTVESFAIGPATGQLTRRNARSSTGNGPTHVSLDGTAAFAMVANYGDGSAAVLPIAADGTLGVAIETVTPGANAHQIFVNAQNGVVYVPCLGANLVAVFGFDAQTGALTPRASAPSAAGAGPRHMVLAPDGAHAWVVNETASSITSYTVAQDGTLTAGATVTTLPAGFAGQNSGAEIAVHPSGQWLYSSNRGHDSIAVFAIGAGGGLTPLGHTDTGGVRPRHFSLAPDGRALLVANQTSGTIHGFRLDPQTGLLTPVGELAAVPSPGFVGVVHLP